MGATMPHDGRKDFVCMQKNFFIKIFFKIPSISDLDKVCTNVAEVTKVINDCKQKASLAVSNR